VFKVRTGRLLPVAIGWVILGGVMAVGGLILTVPQWRAAHGEGRTGTFTLTEPTSCDRYSPPRQRCGWFGDFVSSDGTVVRRRFELAGGLPPGAQIGNTIPARDTGSFTVIYPLTGTPSWTTPAGFAAAGFGACLVGLLILRPWPRGRW
jgi:hypothetical protein